MKLAATAKLWNIFSNQEIKLSVYNENNTIPTQQRSLAKGCKLIFLHFNILLIKKISSLWFLNTTCVWMFVIMFTCFSLIIIQNIGWKPLKRFSRVLHSKIKTNNRKGHTSAITWCARYTNIIVFKLEQLNIKTSIYFAITGEKTANNHGAPPHVLMHFLKHTALIFL